MHAKVARCSELKRIESAAANLRYLRCCSLACPNYVRVEELKLAVASWRILGSQSTGNALLTLSSSDAPRLLTFQRRLLLLTAASAE
jgi:hypothetical protein